jgi:hypothetical protein
LFVEPEHSLIDPPAPRQGVLSQNPGQHQLHLSAADPPAFNQADHHAHMLEHHRIGSNGAPFGGKGLGLARGTFGWRARRLLAGLSQRQATAALIELFLNLFSLGVAVIGAAAPKGLAPPMLLPAAKRAPDETALVHIARVRQKENAAVRTAGPATAQMRFGPQHRSQNHIVFQH